MPRMSLFYITSIKPLLNVNTLTGVNQYSKFKKIKSLSQKSTKTTYYVGYLIFIMNYKFLPPSDILKKNLNITCLEIP